MRLALTKYGWPEVVIFPAIVLGAMIVYLVVGVLYLSAWTIISIEAALAAVLIWFLSFFRDPYRCCPADKNLLLSPADGGVTNIEIVKENDFIGEHAIRIGIFLSIFDVHVNRAPCSAKVARISYKKGKYKNAANPESGRVNESNDLCIIRTDSPEDRLIVRQISGAIARRIVCATKEGQELAGGEKFGMIKFGSRTELYVPARANVKCLVQIGDRVKAGLTPLVRYE
jgi:phosphatidylserine decarboxylase